VPGTQALSRDQPLPCIHEVTGIAFTKFRMTLNAHEVLSILHQVIIAEFTMRQHFRLGWEEHHLILMADDKIKLVLPRLHPGLANRDPVEGHTDSPPLFRFAHLAAKRLRHQLMAEADANQGFMSLP